MHLGYQGKPETQGQDGEGQGDEVGVEVGVEEAEEGELSDLTAAAGVEAALGRGVDDPATAPVVEDALNSPWPKVTLQMAWTSCTMPSRLPIMATNMAAVIPAK